MAVAKMDEDIKDVAKRLIQDNEKRKKRISQKRHSPFDSLALAAVAEALKSSCGNIDNARMRKQMQDKIYQSIVHSTPYEYMGNVYCGRRQFYEYRNEFIQAVAERLGMLPPGDSFDDETQAAAVAERVRNNPGKAISLNQGKGESD